MGGGGRILGVGGGWVDWKKGGTLHGLWIHRDVKGHMTLYVGLYEENLVGKIDCRNPCWVNPGF